MVSIIVPVYNVEDRIGKCIESILAQTFRDFELILIDDGSKDHSLDVCKQYEKKDSRIRLLTQENSGVSATRNRGIQCAKGEYIEFVDSDDYIAPTMVASLVEAIEQTQADMAVCGILKEFPDHEENILPLMDGKVQVRELQQTYPNIFSNYVLHSPVNKLYRREKIQKPFVLDLSFGEDYTFNLTYLRTADSIVFLQQALYYYIIAPNSLINTYSPNRIAVSERLYLEGMAFCQDVGLEQPAKANLSANFLEVLFYALSDLYCFSGQSSAQKRSTLKNIAENPNVRSALSAVQMPRLKQKIGQFLLKRKLIWLFHIMLSTQANLRTN